MIADINLFGLFFDVALITALVAVAALTILRRVLVALGAYRWVWHPPLVDLALFAVLWLALALAATHFQEHLVYLLG
ncbi:DUF1656 domain-containing protein [Piscinibacter sp. XHJ-5]|uniref:DUF1656 domain-containing protein n=1 Tax=Piscinibacter sp. XHJ-5 TaxID=3037797 RepID=UPI002452E13B|nr:DUF1656 domain-containing protein [Piscinibacter sp. XHJ-5]